jgi:Ca2+-binding RTX toxin-like protein
MRARLTALCVMAAALAMPGIAGAAALNPGSILVSTVAANGSILQIDPDTGAETVVASGAPLDLPFGMTVTPAGKVLVADYGAQAILTVDPASGSVSGVPASDFNPIGVDLAPDGRVIASDQGDLPSRLGSIVSVDPASGARTTIAAGGTSPQDLTNPSGLEVAPSGRVYVADNFQHTLFGVDLGTGAVAPVSSDFGEPFNVALTPQGDVLVADYAIRAIIQTDPGTGANSTVASVSGGQLVDTPGWVARGANGSLYVVEGPREVGSLGDVYSLNPAKKLTTGALSPNSVAVVPPTCFGKFATIVGGPKKDKLVGTRFRDVIAGVAGNDRVNGKAGNDLICGGGGDDTLKGGPGNDRVHGQLGDDRLGGGKGKDKLLGGKGENRLGAS